MYFKTVPVSVIIPCYNCEGTLKRALQSVYDQTVLPFEAIVVNDGSNTKATKKIFETANHFDKKVDTKIVLLQRQQGPATARNIGWKEAYCPYLAFLDADDSWHPKKLEIQYEWMRSHPDYSISSHKSTWLKDGGLLPSLPDDILFQKVTPARQLISNRFHTRTVMLKKNISCRFRDGKRYSEDFLLWLEIIIGGGNAAYLDVPLAYTHKPQYGQDGLSSDLWAMERGELDTYHYLFRKGHLSFPILLSLSIWSVAKYIYRIIHTRVR